MKDISKKELLYNLYILKYISSYLDKKEIKNIYFFNINAFCDYLDNKSNYMYCSLDAIKKISKYIPINIYDDVELYILFKKGINSVSLKNIKYIKQTFYIKSMYIFLNLLSKTKTKNDFFIIFNNCDNIRKYYHNKY